MVVCHLDRDDIEYPLQLVHDNPDYFLDELAKWQTLDICVKLPRFRFFATVRGLGIFGGA
jgi:hypothetical protein